MTAPRCEHTDLPIDRWTYFNGEDRSSVFACCRSSAHNAAQDQVRFVLGRDPARFYVLRNHGDEGVDSMTTCEGCEPATG